MRPDLDAYNEMQLPPLEQTAIADLNERSSRGEKSDTDPDHLRLIVAVDN
jgi:hypothetical protein